MKRNCANLYLLSSIACQLTECMDEKQLEALALDLTTLGAMLESLLAHDALCKKEYSDRQSDIIKHTDITV